MAKLEKQSDKKGMYLFWCPGCKCAHYIATAKMIVAFLCGIGMGIMRILLLFHL